MSDSCLLVLPAWEVLPGGWHDGGFAQTCPSWIISARSSILVEHRELKNPGSPRGYRAQACFPMEGLVYEGSPLGHWLCCLLWTEVKGARKTTGRGQEAESSGHCLWATAPPPCSQQRGRAWVWRREP